MQLQSAIFREEKQNARVPNPANTAFNILAGTQMVDGGEIELVGKITDAWQVTASYTYLDGKTIKTVPGGPPLNSPLFNAPRNSVALWTTYQLPMRVVIGGGLNYLSTRFASLTTNPFTSVPGYTTLDLMAKWQATPHIRLQVNVNNVTDKFYFDQIHGFHVIPGEGRTALFTLAYSNLTFRPCCCTFRGYLAATRWPRCQCLRYARRRLGRWTGHGGLSVSAGQTQCSAPLAGSGVGQARRSGARQAGAEPHDPVGGASGVDPAFAVQSLRRGRPLRPSHRRSAAPHRWHKSADPHRSFDHRDAGAIPADYDGGEARH